jgi:glutamate-1-semialdehyde 2,1-aminomutase
LAGRGLIDGGSVDVDFSDCTFYPTIDHVRLTGTYSSNPISAAAALAVIGVLKQPGIYKDVERKGNRLKDALTELLHQAQIPADVIGEATAFQPCFTQEHVIDHRACLTADMGMSFKLIDLLLDRGVVKGHEKFFVSTAHSDDDIDYTIAALREVVELLAD